MKPWFSPGPRGLGIVPLGLPGIIICAAFAAGLAATLWSGLARDEWPLVAVLVIAEVVVFLLVVLVTLSTMPWPGSGRR